MRRNSRKYTLQSLYEWEIANNTLSDIELRILNTQKLGRVDVPYLKTLLHGIEKHVDEIDQKIAPFLDRPLEQLSPIERNILRLAAFELIYQADVPYKVVINEALELAKKFGGQDGHKYVNGVLDKLAQNLGKS